MCGLPLSSVLQQLDIIGILNLQWRPQTGSLRTRLTKVSFPFSLPRFTCSFGFQLYRNKQTNKQTTHMNNTNYTCFLGKVTQFLRTRSSHVANARIPKKERKKERKAYAEGGAKPIETVTSHYKICASRLSTRVRSSVHMYFT